MQITRVVEAILRDQPETRDSDRELLISIMQRYGIELTPRQIVAFRHMPSMETVRRVRQKIQSEGRYTASERISRQRRLKGYVMQQNAPMASTERLERLVEDQPRAVSWLEED